MNLFHLNCTCLLRSCCLGSPPCSHPYIFLNRYFFMPHNNSCGVLHISFQLTKKLILNIETEVCLRVLYFTAERLCCEGSVRIYFMHFIWHSNNHHIKTKKILSIFSNCFWSGSFHMFICLVFFFFWKSPLFGSWGQTLERLSNLVKPV